MPAVHQTIACLRFFGDDLDPDHVSKLLGAIPTTAYRKGAAMPSSDGKKAVAETGSWQLEADEELSGELGEQISALLSGLSDDLSVWRDLSSQYDGDIFLGLFLGEANEGFTLDPTLLSAIGDRGLVLDFDIYASEEDDAYYEDDAVDP
ncbi:DUF4279 domain-containing protein [Rhizobium panacihumi]|uniref:DUF4279 domain-containing protein n=1 Tax=Rhizobium panacihumi TaxID=2008450 RepID=UPI003D7A63D9